MASNPYVPPTFSAYNYNANPPSDDGSQTIANTVSWNGNNGTAGVKPKIGDPLANYAQAVSAAVQSATGTLQNEIDATLSVFAVVANSVPAMGVTVQAGSIFTGGVLTVVPAQIIGAGSSYTGTTVSGASVSGTISGISTMGGLGVGLTISGANISGQAAIFSVNFSGNSITINKAISISGVASFSTLIPAPVTNPRIDLVAIQQTNGLAQYIEGVEAVTPAIPATPVGFTPIGTISTGITTTIITQGNITDERVIFPQNSGLTSTGTISANQYAVFADNTGTVLKAQTALNFSAQTISATTIFTTPANSTLLSVWAYEMVAPGGGGGNTASAANSAGAGGGGGEYTSGFFTGISANATISMTIGAGGANGANGVDGGTTTISGAGVVVTAIGGKGGPGNVTPAVGGIGGTGGTTTGATEIKRIPGQAGGNGAWVSASLEIGGDGGSSILGFGGRGPVGGGSVGSGTAASKYGGGGAGSFNNGGNGTGTAGTSGVIIITRVFG